MSDLKDIFKRIHLSTLIYSTRGVKMVNGMLQKKRGQLCNIFEVKYGGQR